MKIVWSPVHEAEFLTYNSSINLYKIINCSDDDLVSSNQGKIIYMYSKTISSTIVKLADTLWILKEKQVLLVK